MTEHGRDDGKALCPGSCIWKPLWREGTVSKKLWSFYKVQERNCQQNQEKSEQIERLKNRRVNLNHLFLRRFYFTLSQGAWKKGGQQTIRINSTLLGSGNPSRLCGMKKIEEGWGGEWKHSAPCLTKWLLGTTSSVKQKMGICLRGHTSLLEQEPQAPRETDGATSAKHSAE